MKHSALCLGDGLPVGVILSFIGADRIWIRLEAVDPDVRLACLLLGGTLGLALSSLPYKAVGIFFIAGVAGLGLSKSPAYALQLALYLGLGIYWIGSTTRWGINNRYRLELLWIRGLKLFGILALLVAVLFPMAVMVITSLKAKHSCYKIRWICPWIGVTRICLKATSRLFKNSALPPTSGIRCG